MVEGRAVEVMQQVQRGQCCHSAAQRVATQVQASPVSLGTDPQCVYGDVRCSRVEALHPRPVSLSMYHSAAACCLRLAPDHSL